MIADLKPYPTYKDSGVPWVGEVPEHWRLPPNRSLLRPRKTLVGHRHTEYRLLSLTKDGIIVRNVESGRGKFSADMGTVQEVHDGDLVFCLFDVPETPRTVGLSHHNGMITGAYTVFEVYNDQLDEDEQVAFKGNAKTFTRTYGFLAAILPYTDASWEKLSIFLTFLTPKLPAPKEEDLSRGILEAIDMDSYRIEKRAVQSIQLADADGEIEPVPTSGGGLRAEPELDRLSNIVKAFNDQFANIAWTDADRVRKLITEEIPAKVAADVAFQNARKNSDPQNARIEHDKALGRAMIAVMKDSTELFKQFSDNDAFHRWLADTVFDLTYLPAAPETAEVNVTTRRSVE